VSGFNLYDRFKALDAPSVRSKIAKRANSNDFPALTRCKKITRTGRVPARMARQAGIRTMIGDAMSKATATMMMSGVHRITGVALYAGTLLVAWWLDRASISQEYFDWVSWLWGTWFGQLVLFGYTWALMQHMLGGIRHFVWDTGAGLEKHTATKIAWATAGSARLF
jgi:succinate dehydrogenase / fumarate reductase cytochrome b subunit